MTYFYTAFAYDHDSNYASGVNGSGMPVDPTCAFVKQLPDYAPAELGGKVVTAIFSSDGCIYVEEPDWTCGGRGGDRLGTGC